jgi:hypothetical protein
MSRSQTLLPAADDVFNRLDRPPWQAVSSMELSKLLGVPLNWVWNTVMRGSGPAPEADALHVRASNRRFFLPAVVLAWLSNREGTTIPPWQWNRRWLSNSLLTTEQATVKDTSDLIQLLEKGTILKRKWKVRLPLYLARLREL